MKCPNMTKSETIQTKNAKTSIFMTKRKTNITYSIQRQPTTTQRPALHTGTVAQHHNTRTHRNNNW